MAAAFTDYLRGELAQLKEGGLYKVERVITSPQSATSPLRSIAAISSTPSSITPLPAGR